MVGAANYNNGYVEALILGAPKKQLAKPVATTQSTGFSSETIALWSRKWRPWSGA
jgi:hypothetical protein